MAHKLVLHYSAVTDAKGTSGVLLHYYPPLSGLVRPDVIKGLPTEEANYILDLLRHEKPMRHDPVRRRFFSTDESVGEAESDLDLDAWLTGHPAVATAIAWDPPGQGTKLYPSWSSAQKAELASIFRLVRSGESPNLPEAPPQSGTPGAEWETSISPELAWQLYLAYVAQVLATETGQWVNWSILGYSPDALRELLSGPAIFFFENDAYRIPWWMGAATPGDPVRVLSFLVANHLIGETPRKTIALLLEWCRSNLTHFRGGLEKSAGPDTWQYDGVPPVERMIAGTQHSPFGTEHWTAGCWGTVGFLEAVLRTVNIPVVLKIIWTGTAIHALPYFVSEGVYLSHGDDPYNQHSHASPPFPAEELLIDEATYEAWFGSAVPPEQQGKNLGRRPRELAVKYLSLYLLRAYCRDLANGKSHADGEVFAALQSNYALADLEAALLWERMDGKLASLGGCSAIGP